MSTNETLNTLANTTANTTLFEKAWIYPIFEFGETGSGDFFTVQTLWAFLSQPMFYLWGFPVELWVVLIFLGIGLVSYRDVLQARSMTWFTLAILRSPFKFFGTIVPYFALLVIVLTALFGIILYIGIARWTYENAGIAGIIILALFTLLILVKRTKKKEQKQMITRR